MSRCPNGSPFGTFSMRILALASCLRSPARAGMASKPGVTHPLIVIPAQARIQSPSTNDLVCRPMREDRSFRVASLPGVGSGATHAHHGNAAQGAIHFDGPEQLPVFRFLAAIDLHRNAVPDRAHAPVGSIGAGKSAGLASTSSIITAGWANMIRRWCTLGSYWRWITGKKRRSVR